MTNRLDDKDEFRLALELNAEAMRILKTSLIEYMAAHDFNLPSKKKEGVREVVQGDGPSLLIGFAVIPFLAAVCYFIEAKLKFKVYW